MNRYDDIMQSLTIFIDNNMHVNSQLGLLSAELKEPDLTIEELRKSCLAIVDNLARANVQSALDVGELLEKHL
jgi:Holliday junction resolvasome RuvABC endonuclease subunit